MFLPKILNMGQFILISKLIKRKAGKWMLICCTVGYCNGWHQI